MARNSKTPAMHLNLNVRGLPLSATLHINELSNRLIREGRHVYKLGLGQSPFPVPEPVEEELKANAFQKDYLPVLGLYELRQSISNYFSRAQGAAFSPHNIIVGPGSKELMFILQLVYYGDLVIPTPSWVSYAPQARIIGRNIHWLQTKSSNGWRLQPEEVENLCKADPDRPRLIILNYPNNPHGNTFKPSELKALARVAAKYRVLLLSDEIYGELNHSGDHVSIARYYPEGTIISSGLSKWCGAGGWRLGLFAFPESLNWLKEAMAVVASETFTSTSAPIQYAAVRAFRGGTVLEEYLRHSRTVLRALGRHMARRMRKAGVRVDDPEGGFYLFPDFGNFRDRLKSKGVETSPQLAELVLKETGVAFLPGNAFGRPADELTVRMAYVDFDGAKALSSIEGRPEGFQPDDQWLEIHCPNCVQAMDELIKWLK